MQAQWHNSTYTNVLLSRSSLFRVGNRQVRADCRLRTIQSELTKRFNTVGSALSTYDYDMLLALRYFATKPCEKTQLANIKKRKGLFNQHEAISCVLLNQLFVRLNKQAYGRTDYILVKASIKRLANVYCDIEYANLQFTGKLFLTLRTERAGKQIFACFNPDFIDFFNHTPAIDINLKQYCDLPQGLARWLYGFWSTYAVIPMTELRTLYNYSGSTEKRRANFRSRLCNTLDKLAKVGFIAPAWSISRDGVILAKRVRSEISIIM